MFLTLLTFQLKTDFSFEFMNKNRAKILCKCCLYLLVSHFA